MAILSTLKVTEVAELRAEANSFITHADETRAITRRMIELVEQSNSVWKGDAQNRFMNQFLGLSDDMERIYMMCSEYGDDLLRIADNYEKAENSNIVTAQRLKSDVELGGNGGSSISPIPIPPITPILPDIVMDDGPILPGAAIDPSGTNHIGGGISVGGATIQVDTSGGNHDGSVGAAIDPSGTNHIGGSISVGDVTIQVDIKTNSNSGTGSSGSYHNSGGGHG